MISKQGIEQTRVDVASVQAEVDNIDGDSIPAMVGTNSAALASVLGALNSAASTGAVTTSDLVMAYIKQLVTEGIARDTAIGNIPTTMVGTNSAMLAASGARILNSLDFWSDVGLSVTVTGGQTTVTTGLNNVVVADLPSGMTVVRAYAMMKFRMVENTHATIVNKLDAASALPMQLDDVGNTGMFTCLDFADDIFTLAAVTKEGGDVIIGDIDVTARVDGNDTYDFQWLNAKADQNNLVFHDVQMGLRIWYSL